MNKQDVKKIKVTKENYGEIAEKLFFHSITFENKKMKPQKIPYIDLLVVDPVGVSSKTITAIIPIKDEKDNKIILWDQGVFFYEEILKLLLSHPRVSEIYYIEDKNIVTAIFEVPEEFWDEEDDWDD